MMGNAGIRRRQIWARPTTSTPTTASTCTPYLIPSNGVLNFNRTYATTLTDNLVYQPACTGNGSWRTPAAVVDFKDPFYSSTSSQLYAMGCVTILSYVLVIILLITPHTFFVGGPGGGASFLGRHGVISASYNRGSTVIGVGGRPWLQKVAALMVAISLTIATVDTFKVAEHQYIHGYMDSAALMDQVLGGTEIRIVRVISSTFLWLAQVQTLIRLFPRHKEKVMIKWAGFALIVLDTIFSILDNFVAHGSATHPRTSNDAIPALSYLFELALNLLYAAWVIFYSLSKHRYAFFHPQMQNICLVAVLSLISVLIPVVFFVMDISQPGVAGWGAYIRWVGSAAASVVVWEWVERIEALERDEKKDGILGREVFDGDEMLEITPSEEVDWPRQPIRDCGDGFGTSTSWAGVVGWGHRPLRTRAGFQRGSARDHQSVQGNAPGHPKTAHLTPPAAVTPISRADTTSAASTVYNVHYYPASSPPPRAQTVSTPEVENHQEKEITLATQSQPPSDTRDILSTQNTRRPVAAPLRDHWWSWIPGLFNRQRTSPPREIVTAQEQEHSVTMELHLSDEDEDGSLRSQVHNLLSLHRRKDRHDSDSVISNKPLPVTIIQPKTRDTLSPQRSHRINFKESQPHQTSSSQSNLPVRIIPAQRRPIAPWPMLAADSVTSGRSHRLRYDPDTAALIGVEPDLDLPPRHLQVDIRDYSTRDTSSGNETLVASERYDQYLYDPRGITSPEAASLDLQTTTLDHEQSSIERVPRIHTSEFDTGDVGIGVETLSTLQPRNSTRRQLGSGFSQLPRPGDHVDLEAGPNSHSYNRDE